MASKHLLKPLLKWVGGKTQLLEKIFEKVPHEINHYYEPFVGGGSVLFELLNRIEEGSIQVKGEIMVSDDNASLIQLYQDIKERVNECIEKLNEVKDAYQQCGDEKIDAKKIVYPIPEEETKKSKELFYYFIRQKYNELIKNENAYSIMKSVYFIFLNKTCFRGLYRVGPKGYNVPYGNYKNPSIFQEAELIHISEKLNQYNVIFKHQSFETFFESTHFEEDDFVYLDPPYVPEKKSSFVKYQEDGFDDEKHILLFTKIQALPSRFLLSNSNVPLLHTTFGTPKYQIDIVSAKRAIQSNDPTAITQEVLIYK